MGEGSIYPPIATYPPSLPPCLFVVYRGDNPLNNVYGVKKIYGKNFGKLGIFIYTNKLIKKKL
jgi:hypothetical protein